MHLMLCAPDGDSKSSDVSALSVGVQSRQKHARVPLLVHP